MRVDFLRWQDPAWHQAAALIEGHFRSIYGASLTMPAVELAAITTHAGRLAGAAGIRDAEQGFFSQAYLDRPVEALLSEASGHAVAATEIVEVVSMACPQPRATLPLIEAITEEGRRRGKHWGLFTATGPLMRMLERLGVPLIRLVPARPARLPGASLWGSYYATDPWVCALPDESRALHFLPRRAPQATGARLA